MEDKYGGSGFQDSEVEKLSWKVKNYVAVINKQSG
jgi:hypothetical protein